MTCMPMSVLVMVILQRGIMPMGMEPIMLGIIDGIDIPGIIEGIIMPGIIPIIPGIMPGIIDGIPPMGIGLVIPRSEVIEVIAISGE